MFVLTTFEILLKCGTEFSKIVKEKSGILFVWQLRVLLLVNKVKSRQSFMKVEKYFNKTLSCFLNYIRVGSHLEKSENIETLKNEEILVKIWKFQKFL